MILFLNNKNSFKKTHSLSQTESTHKLSFFKIQEVKISNKKGTHSNKSQRWDQMLIKDLIIM